MKNESSLVTFMDNKSCLVTFMDMEQLESGERTIFHLPSDGKVSESTKYCIARQNGTWRRLILSILETSLVNFKEDVTNENCRACGHETPEAYFASWDRVQPEFKCSNSLVVRKFVVKYTGDSFEVPPLDCAYLLPA